MEDFVRHVLSNSLFAIAAGGVCFVIIFFVLKKTVKLLLYAFLFLIALLAYMYYSGESVSTIVKPIQSAIRKNEKSAQKNTAVDAVPKKVQKTKHE